MKKILIIIGIFLLIGCTNTNINTLTLEEIIDNQIKEENKLNNTNNKGFKYYLPTEFSVKKDADYVQELISHNDTYYMNVDIVSYYYKNKIQSEPKLDDYEYFTFNNNDNYGYLRITKNNDYFFVELCYNYAIIEVEVEEEDLKYAISRSIIILNSIKYNDLVIEKNIVEDNIETGESKYSIPQPENKSSSKNVLEYIKENDG